MIKVVFLGFGNVNQQLCRSLQKSDHVDVLQIYNRNSQVFSSEWKGFDFTTQLSEIKSADVYIIGITDDAIASFSETIPFRDRLVVHTSGSVSLKALSNHNKRGVFYPLQTFTKTQSVNFTNIPICIEAENASDLKLLHQLGSLLSENVTEVSSEAREKVHLAAVFVNNFVNHLYHISEELLTEHELDFKLLQPLIAETARKIKTLSPAEAQTGPAKRNDHKTIENHLHLLEGSPYIELYKMLTISIQEQFK